MKKLPILPTLIVLLAAATMVWLGVWQLQRRSEKQALIAHAVANSGRAPIPLPASITDDALFAQVTVTCTKTGDWSMSSGRATDDSTGFRHIVACRTADGRDIRIDKGVSPDLSIKPSWPGGSVTGSLTHAPGGGTLIDRMFGAQTPPVRMIVATIPAPGLKPSRQPDPASLPDNHLAYAIQWFAFAAGAILIYMLALRRRSR